MAQARSGATIGRANLSEGRGASPRIELRVPHATLDAINGTGLELSLAAGRVLGMPEIQRVILDVGLAALRAAPEGSPLRRKAMREALLSAGLVAPGDTIEARASKPSAKLDPKRLAKGGKR